MGERTRILAVAVAALALALTVPVLAQEDTSGVNSAEGVNGTATLVIDGTDRYDTAAQIALSVWGDYNTTQVLYIANGETLVDALTVGVSHNGAEAMLLVKHDEVPAPTRDALQQINHAKLVFLGGAAVISPEVRAEVESLTCNYVTEGPCG